MSTSRLCRFLWLCLAALALTGCVTPIAGLYPPAQGEPTETVFIVNHGWHTGIIVETPKLPPGAQPSWSGIGPSKFTEFGWGDDGFYRAEKVTSGIALRAMFWCNPSVLHVVAMDKEPAKYFPYSGLIKVVVSTNGFNKLCDYLSASFATNSLGQRTDLGKGIYGDSRFFQATGHYYFPNTCNKWTARALRSTGFPISSFYAIRAANVFSQTRKSATVLQELSDQ